jgi:thioredoxin reductase/Fe-S-cluster-containing hydrogenase component 2/CRP-like cAMP-binding protein
MTLPHSLSRQPPSPPHCQRRDPRGAARMSVTVQLAIIGAGPGGLSAAVTAAERKLSHVLLERADHLSDTIYKYQKGKAVMAHPMRLPLLGGLPFAEGKREDILRSWNAAAAHAGVRVVYRAEVQQVRGALGNFQIKLGNGQTITAEKIILAIGLQGNLRKLEVAGAARDWVHYQLDDPDAYAGERIVVIGGGDAGIENALALAKQNDVTIVNRSPDFSRAKPKNLGDIERAIRCGAVRAYQSAAPTRIDERILVIETREGEVRLPTDRIIARLGAIPPRRFLNECGITLPSDDPAAVPELTDAYESNVPGLYIIGALAGYTLIKQAINQGHELVMRIAGAPVAPADDALLRARFATVFPASPVGEVLEWLRARVPILASLTILQLREAMLDSNIVRFADGEIVCNRGDYTSSLWNVAEGAAMVQIPGSAAGEGIRIEAGSFFGELGLISGRRRNAAVCAAGRSIMVEIPRRTMRRLQSAVASIGAELDRVALRRIVHYTLGRLRPIADMEGLIAAASLRQYKAGTVIVNAGDTVDALYIVRTGSVTVSSVVAGRDVDLDYIEAGGLFGERGFIGGDTRRAATVRTTIATEAVRIEAHAVRAALQTMPELRVVFGDAVAAQLDQSVQRAIADARRLDGGRAEPAATAFLVREGIGEATNAFFIDETLCTRCGNCETACAATHDGISRVSRESGKSAVSILLPVACRHCENPHCMTDCPPDAIQREASGEVVINQDTCIGCSNCANNCPYGVISMVYPSSGAKPAVGWLGWLMQGLGLPAPAQGHVHAHVYDPGEPHALKAVKCDLCRGAAAGPACVSACPTGAAVRMDPDAYMAWLREGRGLA